MNRAILTATFTFSATVLVLFVIIAMVLRGHRGITAGLIYGGCLLLCSLCSYIYTRYETASLRWLMRHFDHAAIFLLIAGTYTPFAASGIDGPFGISLLAWVWGLAFCGISLRLLIRKGYDRLFIGLYLIQGWMIVTSLPSVIQHVALLPVVLLAIGAIVYTLGALIFARDIGKWTDPVWHGCVLTASCLHFFAVLIFLFISSPV